MHAGLSMFFKMKGINAKFLGEIYLELFLEGFMWNCSWGIYGIVGLGIVIGIAFE